MTAYPERTWNLFGKTWYPIDKIYLNIYLLTAYMPSWGCGIQHWPWAQHSIPKGNVAHDEVFSHNHCLEWKASKDFALLSKFPASRAEDNNWAIVKHIQCSLKPLGKTFKVLAMPFSWETLPKIKLSISVTVRKDSNYQRHKVTWDILSSCQFMSWVQVQAPVYLEVFPMLL